MSTSRYSEIARSAALHEKAGSLDQAAKFWRQANPQFPNEMHDR